jgi:D-alanyl-D-alanine carboxypeptidase
MWQSMITRFVTVAVAALLVLVAAGCSDDSATRQGSATSPPTSSTAESENPMNAAAAQRIDAAVTLAMSGANVPGAIVGLWGPDGSYVRSFGVADKATGAPMKTDFYSRIGSQTKTFTVSGVQVPDITGPPATTTTKPR